MGHTLVVTVCALLAGVAGAAPYAVGLAVLKKKRDGSILRLVGAACVSVVVIAASVLITYVTIREELFLFACVLVVALLAVTVVSVVLYGRKPRP